MLKILFSIFLVCHGLVHLLYAGQSRRSFELRPNMTWPDGAWMLSRFLNNETIRLLALVMLGLAALGFAMGGVGLFFNADWCRMITTVSTVYSTILFLVFWDGKFQAVDDQGGIGILINLAILVALLIFRWPA